MSVRSTEDNMDLQLVSEVQGMEQTCRSELLTCEMRHYLPAHRDSIELNCRMPNWCHRITEQCGKNLHTMELVTRIIATIALI